MTWIDAHLDLAFLALNGRDLRREVRDPSIGCVSLPALREAKVDLVLATIFTDPTADSRHNCVYDGFDDLDGAEAAGRRQLEVYQGLEDEGEIRIVRTRSDLTAPGPRPAVVLLMEGADPIRGAEKVREWHDAGLRAVGLTWSFGTRYAGGNGTPGPLTALGRELVAALDDVGIIHDASHLADQALADLLTVARGPIVATHSNCRALMTDDQRHLRDDQIEAIAARGGIIGLNLFSKFLVPEGRARIVDCVAHVERIAQLTGQRTCIGLGSDADGGFTALELPIGLEHHRDLVALDDALSRIGWSAEDREGFRCGNWMGLLERVLPAGVTAPG